MANSIQKTILLADNSPDYRRSSRALLELEGYQVVEADSVAEAIRQLRTRSIDLVLADLRLTNDGDAGDISGLEVTKAAAELSIPRVIITAFPSVQTTREALRRHGREPLADDYVPKADGPQALLDVVKIILERPGEVEAGASGDLLVDLERRLVWHRDEPVNLSKQQYELVAYLCERQGAACSAEELLKAVYDEDVPAGKGSADKRLERLIRRLREKIEEDISAPTHLVNVPRRGYRLIARIRRKR